MLVLSAPKKNTGMTVISAPEVNPPALLKPGRAAKCKAARTAPPPPTEGPGAEPRSHQGCCEGYRQSPPSEQTTPAAESTASAESTLGLDKVEVNSGPVDAPDSCSAQALGLPEHRASVQRDRPGQAGAHCASS